MPTSSKLTNEMDVEIGQRIRALRLAAGLSQSELGAVLGVTFQQSQKIEAGKNRIGAGALVLICKRLGVTPMDILGQYFDNVTPSEVSALAQQVTLLKSQLADVRAAVKASVR